MGAYFAATGFGNKITGELAVGTVNDSISNVFKMGNWGTGGVNPSIKVEYTSTELSNDNLLAI